jgi:iron complex outermembrane receptor protein
MPKLQRLVCLALACMSGLALAQSEDEEDLALVYGDKEFISIATGNRQPVRNAPAATTVITAADIEAMGATDLDEVLEAVPGVHVSKSASGYNPIYVFRGIYSQFNPHVLVLMNGVPMTSVYLNDRGDIWAGMPLENVARIEVIRGPGSALYGADAFAGVVNIITKSASEINGARFGVRAGSFNTQNAWIQYGGVLGPIETAAYFRVGRTDGQREIIREDAQSGFDSIFSTSASFAPGQVNLGYDAADAQLELGYESWRLRFGYRLRDDGETGAGIANALDPFGSNRSIRTIADLIWQKDNLVTGWSVTAQASFMRQANESRLVLFPPGAFGGAFPDGMIGNPDKWERQGRYSLSALYSGWTGHRLRLGIGHDDLEIYRVRESKNFTLVPTLMPLGSVVDVSDTNPFLTPHERRVNYLYAQDEWNVARDWMLTLGVRYDKYSDFGETVNPRAALVWAAAHNVTAKLLYGQAFRAPSFAELYAINNPTQLGNPALQPERIRTWEGVVTWQPTADSELNLGVFRHRMSNIIGYVAMPAGITAANTGKQKGHGFELEGSWKATRDLRLSANYAWQRNTDESTGADAGNAPRQQVYGRADWRFLAGWQASTQLNWVMDRRRVAGDTRPDVPDYHTVDLTLRSAAAGRGWDVAASVRNLFDEDAFEPSLAGSGITFDLPLPGRSFWLQLRYGL